MNVISFLWDSFLYTEREHRKNVERERDKKGDSV